MWNGGQVFYDLTWKGFFLLCHTEPKRLAFFVRQTVDLWKMFILVCWWNFLQPFLKALYLIFIQFCMVVWIGPKLYCWCSTSHSISVDRIVANRVWFYGLNLRSILYQKLSNTRVSPKTPQFQLLMSLKKHKKLEILFKQVLFLSF